MGAVVAPEARWRSAATSRLELLSEEDSRTSRRSTWEVKTMKELLGKLMGLPLGSNALETSRSKASVKPPELSRVPASLHPSTMRPERSFTRTNSLVPGAGGGTEGEVLADG
jgi:hypothetical protein